MQLRTALRVAIPTFIIIALLSLSLGKELFNVPPTQADPGEETTYYLLTDHLGSVDVVLDDQGNVVERRDFLPYGEERLADSTTAVTKTDHKFTGKELDDETGLYYYGARYYDAEIGRFVSVDPWEGEFKVPQTLNKYAYTINNPVKYVDPTGQMIQIPVAVAAIAAWVGGGALVGTAGQAASDIIVGEVSDWQEYAGAAAGGAVQGGFAAINPGAALLVGGSAAAGMVSAGLPKILRGEDVTAEEIITGGVIGGMTGALPVPAGAKGSATSLTKQMTTKFSEGLIQNVTSKTATNMFVGATVMAAPGAFADEGLQLIVDSAGSLNATQDVSIGDWHGEFSNSKPNADAAGVQIGSAHLNDDEEDN